MVLCTARVITMLMATTLDMVHSRWNQAWWRSDKRMTTAAITWSYFDDRKMTFVNNVLGLQF